MNEHYHSIHGANTESLHVFIQNGLAYLLPDFTSNKMNILEVNEENVVSENTIKNIQSEHIKKLSEWEKLHPNFQEDPKLLAEWQSTLENISGGTKKEQVKNQT